ncbi:MAG: hypothetical protein AB1697_00425 [Pseudomonadota bacterium]
MNKLGLLAFAAQFAPRLLQVRRGTWIAVAVGLVLLFGLLIWAAVALLGWLFGQAAHWFGAAQQAAAGPAQGALAQVERLIPEAREQLADYLPRLQAEPVRDVSGQDLGPVPRYPGLARTVWQQEADRLIVEYAGRADYAALLEHYAKGYAALGFGQTVLSAKPDAETHEYAKAGERYRVTLTRKAWGEVGVRIESGRL